MSQKKRVLLGMSGGVDSTAAAVLLQEQGYEVTGATLRLQDAETEAKGNAARDLADAQQAAGRLGIRHMVLDLREQFRREVLQDFADCYDRGETPNPCVVCNGCIKFRSLFEAADREGIEFVATGHYALVLWDAQKGQHRLHRASNLKKDQSYALYRLKREWLGRLALPLGGFTKEEIRAVAAGAGLTAAKKADSQDICFVPDGDYHAFLERFLGRRSPEGDFVDEDGKVLGRHKGIWHYTVGQRKGLGISLGAPAFVKEIQAESGRVVLSGNDSLFGKELQADRVNWLAFEALEAPLQVGAKIRYAHQPAAATVYPDGEGRVRVVFEEAQRAITPGQAVVFYDGGFVLGGGTIL